MGGGTPESGHERVGFRILADASLCVTLLAVLLLHFKETLALSGCEVLNETKLQWLLIGSNFGVLVAAANMELFHRLHSFVRRSQLIGIIERLTKQSVSERP